MLFRTGRQTEIRENDEVPWISSPLGVIPGSDEPGSVVE
jgi:hypothetical protein